MDNMMTMDDRQIRDNLEVEKRLISETDTLLRSMMELDESYFKENSRCCNSRSYDDSISCLQQQERRKQQFIKYGWKRSF